MKPLVPSAQERVLLDGLQVGCLLALFGTGTFHSIHGLSSLMQTWGTHNGLMGALNQSVFGMSCRILAGKIALFGGCFSTTPRGVSIMLSTLAAETILGTCVRSVITQTLHISQRS